jgi:hypothetical protein
MEESEMVAIAVFSRMSELLVQMAEESAEYEAWLEGKYWDSIPEKQTVDI